LFGHLKTSPSWGEVPFLCPKILTNQGLGLLQNAPFPKKLGLVNSDKGITSISRGYAIIVDGNLIESKAEDYFAKQAHEIVQRAKMTTIN